MLIGELVKKTQLSRDCIRYYEKMGLLQVEAGNSRYNNYKNYTSDSVARLEMIVWAKELGFSLREIKEALDLWSGNLLSVEEKRRLILEKVSSVELKIVNLNKMKELLLEVYKDISPDCLEEYPQ